MRQLILLIFILILFQTSSIAQLSSGGEPLRTEQEQLKSEQVFELPPLPEKHLLNRPYNDRLARTKTYTFAYSFEVDIHPGSSGTWYESGGRYDIWQVKILARDALSVGLVFSEYELVDGVRVFIFNNDRSLVYGAYTSLNNKAWGRLAVSHMPGDEITLQMEVPKNLNRQYGKLRVGSVAHAYRNIFLNKTDPYDRFGLADTCNVDINCDAGQDWQDTKRAVCRIIIENVQLCSGCLINNARNDGAPYVYMSDHSFYEPSRVYPKDAIFYFNYECSECDCDSLIGYTDHSISGSTKLAGGDSIDMALVELSVIPPDSFNVYYAGWNRSEEAPSQTISIHHPRGDVKKITFDYDAPQNGYHEADYYPQYVLYSHWRIVEWDMGTTQPGSSGGPLFDPQHRIIGSLTGGEATCASNVNDYYTRFSYAWDYNEETNKQLKAWLDPDSTGVMVLDGLDPLITDAIVPGSEPGLRVYPNPSSGLFTLDVPEHSGQGALVMVYSIDGKVVYSSRTHAPGSMHIDLSEQTGGLYVLVVHMNGKASRCLISKQ